MTNQNTAAKNLMLSQHNVNNPKSQVVIDLTNQENTENRAEPAVWMENDLYKLYESDREILLSSTAWLNDNIIAAAGNIRKQKMPLKNGFQLPILGQICAFTIEKEEFVPILNNGRGHWLTVSTMGAKENEVQIYDSLYLSVNTRVQVQIPSLLCTISKTFTVRRKIFAG